MRLLTDKVAHGYLPSYLRIAADLGPSARVLEVGVQHGHGLDMLQALFPSGLITGVDADGGCRWPEGTHRVICDQDSDTLPGKLFPFSAQWDLIIDDASHDGALTAATFGLLWPLVAPGGFYVIEDWQVAFGWPGYDRSMLAAAAGLLPLLGPGGDAEEITYRHGLAIARRKRLTAGGAAGEEAEAVPGEARAEEALEGAR